MFSLSGFTLAIVIFSLIVGAITFYQTIITKKWRNRVTDEDQHWKLAILYFNPDDRRVFLPKRTGLGFTLNFANPWSIAILIAIVALFSYM